MRSDRYDLTRLYGYDIIGLYSFAPIIARAYQFCPAHLETCILGLGLRRTQPGHFGGDRRKKRPAPHTRPGPGRFAISQAGRSKATANPQRRPGEHSCGDDLPSPSRGLASGSGRKTWRCITGPQAGHRTTGQGGAAPAERSAREGAGPGASAGGACWAGEQPSCRRRAASCGRRPGDRKVVAHLDQALGQDALQEAADECVFR